MATGEPVESNFTPDNLSYLGSGLVRNPHTFGGAVLLASDFDGTKFLTDEPAPDGVNVNEAYTLAIDSVLGPRAADDYKLKGHQSRNPIEIVRDYAPDATGNELSDLTNRVTEIKLSHLLKNIGRPLGNSNIWPRPTPGFLDFWKDIYRTRQAGRLIDTAEISSGHEEFIRLTYDAWGIPQPDIFYTQETIHQLLLYSEPLERVKPSPLPMRVIIEQWLELYGDPNAFETDQLETVRRKILYVGDDISKDGGLAKNSGVDFVLIPHTGSVEAWKEVAGRLGIGGVAVRGATA